MRGHRVRGLVTYAVNNKRKETKSTSVSAKQIHDTKTQRGKTKVTHLR